MSERDIFLAAIEIADLVQRASYIAEACGADSKLRAQVEELLKTHEQSSQFLETPAVASDSSVAQTFLTASSNANENPHAERASAQAEFQKYLQSTCRTGWLGRLGHYEIEAILGQGAFGIVAKAFDEKLHRVVAIKLMNPELAATSPPRKRFLREARTAAAVTHENIVSIHAVEEEPIPYIVMEYIAGKTLQQRMDEHGPLEVPEILRIGQQVAAGLTAAHAVKLIHRDIKPSNILLADGPLERAKISDFGLARAVDDATLTSSGLIAGTPMYMAPEQARGEPLDHRADLFSLGSVLYMMASGRPPFRAANSMAVLKRVCEDTPRPLNDVIPGIPGWLETVIFRLLEKDRDARYQTAQEVADLLARCQSELQHHGQVTCVPGRSAAAAKTQVLSARTGDRAAPGRRPIGLWAAGAAGMVLLVVIPFLFNPWSGHRETSDGTSSDADGNLKKSATKVTDWHGWPADAPQPAIFPFDADQAKKHQEEWAQYLKVPVEYTNSIGMTFRLIPPGEFLMGSPEAETRQIIQRHALATAVTDEIVQSVRSESPQHDVVQTLPFYLAICEATRAQFPVPTSAAGVSEGVAVPPAEANDPASASWDAVARYCNQLSQQDGMDELYDDRIDLVQPREGNFGYRLPTEAEWEYACRAGTRTRYWTGDDRANMVKVEWRLENSEGRAHPVGQRLANPFGLHDMQGNLREWCQDAYHHDTYSRRKGAPVVDPLASSTAISSPAVIRGGEFRGSNEWDARAAVRRPQSRDNPGPGFRLTLSIEAIRHLYPRRVVQAALDMNGYIDGTLNGRAIHIDREDADQLRQRGELKIGAITLRGGPSITNEGLLQIADLPDLGHLSIIGSRLTDRGLENLGDYPQLKSLYLEGGRQTSKSLAAIGRWTQLEQLTMHSLQFTDDHLEELAGLQELQSIRAGNLVMTEAQTAALSRLPKLKALWLMGDQLTNDTLRGASRLPALTTFAVSFAENSSITNEGASALAANERIVSVNLGGTKVDDRGLASMAERKNWEEFLLDGTRVTDAGLVALRELPKLRTLWLSRTAIGDQGLQSIGKCEALEVLYIKETRITDAGLAHLEPLTKLRELHLDRTHITAEGVARLRTRWPNCRISAEQLASDTPADSK